MLKRFLTLATLLAIGLAASVDAQRLIVTDSGSVEREVSRLLVVDSGGTTREIQRLFVVDSGGTSRLVYSGSTVTVSGESILSSSASGPVRSSVIFNTDGTVDKFENGVQSQIDAATDWIIPNGSASSTYQIRFTNLVGTINAGGTTLTEDVWASMDQNHEVRVIRTGADGPGQTIATFDIEIRLGTGSTLDSGSYTLEAELT